MADAFSNINDLQSQGRKLILLTSQLSDTVNLTDVPKALYISAAGNIAIDPVDTVAGLGSGTGATNVVIAVTAGQVFDMVRVGRIRTTGTTATVYGIY